MMGRSKILARIARNDERIAEYEYDPDNDAGQHWLHLNYPWATPDGSVHESTVTDCLASLRGAVRIP